MISIQVQEAEVFDRLSILEVKYNKTNNLDIKNNLNKQIEELKAQINLAIGHDLEKLIYNSKLYKNLYNTNYKLYEFVDLAKKDQIKASEVDNYVYIRHLAKKELQEEFFNNSFEEVKIGYK